MGNLITTPKVNVNDYDTFDQQRIKINNGLNDFDNYNAQYPYIHSVSFTSTHDDDIGVLTPSFIHDFNNNVTALITMTYDPAAYHYLLTNGGVNAGANGIAAQGMSFQVDNRGGDTHMWRIHNSTPFIVKFMTVGGILKTHTYTVSSLNTAGNWSYDSINSWANPNSVGYSGFYINAFRGAAGLNAIGQTGNAGINIANVHPSTETGLTTYTPLFNTFTIS
jgi:hypothetical protein